MEKRKWVGLSVSLIIILGVVSLCALLFWDDDNESLVPETETGLVDWNEIGDLNEDGEYNVLDLVLHVKQESEK